MPTDIRWIASAPASCFHAAEALSRGQPLTDAALADAISVPTAALRAEVVAAGLPREAFWQHLVALSTGIENHRQLAQRVLAKTIGPGSRQEQLGDVVARHFVDLSHAFNAALPGLVEQLELRSAPLREQWEGRGPGLLHETARLTDPEFVVATADVVLVHPALGGGGAAHLLYNSVRLEAMLANPWPQLPEVARLGWLIAQLNLDLPKHQGELNRDQAARLGALALTPITLAAGEAVELTRCDPGSLQSALTIWQSPAATIPAGALAASLWDWWQVYRDTRPAWPVAIAALARML